MVELQSEVDYTITKIFHLADIHIRNFIRHSEYDYVFKKTFDYIKENADEHSLIVLAGDIVHSKNEMTPELIEMVTKLFNYCVDICPTIVIAGNHDTNLNNSNRMDALTPIVNAINNRNLHYFKDSGLYEFNNVVFSVYGILDDESNWVPANQIHGDKFKIAMYHGPIASAIMNETSTVDSDIINSHNKNISIFDGFDLTLLGDIHVFQYLNLEKTIAYPGSHIQQNFGEDLVHGFIEWDIPEKTSKFIPIQNEIAFYTINVSENEVINPNLKEEINSLPKNLKLRIKYFKTSETYIHDLIQKFKGKFNIVELTLIKQDDNQIHELSNKYTFNNVRSPKVQNELIDEWTSLNNIELQHNTIDDIKNLNNDLLTDIRMIDNNVSHDLMWKPISFDFSNMFSYGPDNHIDFTTLNGLVGLFAANASGKSSLLDAMTYCLFDKSPRSTKSIDVLNNKSDFFTCKFLFELNSIIYGIERSGKFANKKQDSVKVDVKFYKIENGEEISLNGNERDSTNKNIRDIIGNYDDFLLTTLSSQNDNKNFIFKSQRERKELLNSFLDIKFFDELYVISKERLKERDILINNLFHENLYNDIDVCNNNIDSTRLNISKIGKDIQTLNEKRKSIESECKDISSKINNSIQFIDIDKINHKLNLAKNQTDEYNLKLKSLYDTKETLECTIDELSDNVLTNTYENDQTLKKLNGDLLQQQKQFRTIQARFKELEWEINSCNNLIKKLKNHEYDPNCKFCIENSFVKDAIESSKKLPDLQKEGDASFNELSVLKLSITALETEITKHTNEVKKLAGQLSYAQTELQLTLKEINFLEQNLQSNEQIIKESLDLIKLYDTQIDIQNTNKKLNLDIETLQNELTLVINSINTSQRECDKYAMILENLESNLQELLNQKNNVERLIKEKELYDVYCNMMSKQGISYLLIKKIIPILENEINKILIDIVDFTVSIQSDNTNINCYINYKDNKWLVEMASGMEKFIISLAFRIALINISILPRPNFIAIDEGFGVLDAENVNSIDTLFDYIRNKFDFIICVSHLDAMRDIVDQNINVMKSVEGQSKII